jgi:undecaprenyl diphosphate synthase|tara:strand:+ start:979 stop:1695 length:717 start_codon:yes stop_codon:yes gene_type:complete
MTCSEENVKKIPNHVAIIMDGNGRWAKSKGKSRIFGHQAGTNNIRNIIEVFASLNVKYLTLFAFSTENWNRPNKEVSWLLELMFKTISKELSDLNANGVKIQHIGRLDRISSKLKKAIENGIELTKNNSRIVVNVAFDYGGRYEIIDAVKRIRLDNISPENITEQLFNKYLYTKDTPYPDLIIRTAGEMRISNFLLWQSAYSEYYYTDVLWPDFGRIEIEKSIKAYSERVRRFGKLES